MQTLGQYLSQRLYDFGIKHIFGVPGDYVLGLMDVLLQSPIDLICTCNELNAGYAADAYARLNGIGAVCITYGVGGLSLVNAVVGAYAERIPLVVISGSPSSSSAKNQLLLHHTTGDLQLQYQIMQQATVAAAILTHPQQAAAQIEKVLTACLHYKRPVYLEIPTDVVNQPCQPLEFQTLAIKEKLSDQDTLTEAIKEAVTLLEKASKPVIIAGVEFHRFNLQEKLLKLLEKTGYPFATTILGKACITERHEQFIGNYVGATSQEYVRERVEDADAILCLGAIMSDVNLGVYTAELNPKKLINANSEIVKIGYHSYQPIYLGDFLDSLITELSYRDIDNLDIVPAYQSLATNYRVEPEAKLTNKRFYQRLNYFLDKEFGVIADTGDAIFGAMDLIMHQNAYFIGQAFYLSLGYATPACLGAALALPDIRPIVLVGDGGFQMTAQELSTIIRNKLNPIIFLINNEGYTIERVIHDGSYNDLQPWKYHQLPQIFGPSWSCEVFTEGELETALIEAKKNIESVSFIEVHLDQFDCSYALNRLGEAISQMNKLS